MEAAQGNANIEASYFAPSKTKDRCNCEIKESAKYLWQPSDQEKLVNELPYNHIAETDGT
jgi:hypothetical protein